MHIDTHNKESLTQRCRRSTNVQMFLISLHISTVPDTPKFPFNARIRLYWPLVRSHSICSHSLSGECELMRYIWPKANACIRGHSCAHSHLGISHSHNSINYPIQMRALASRCYAHSHYLALLKQRYSNPNANARRASRLFQLMIVNVRPIVISVLPIATKSCVTEIE